MSIDISNKLTSKGINSIYKKLFDTDNSINKAFFSNTTTLLKLRLYISDTSYILSTTESYEIIDNKLVFSYTFSDLNNTSVTSIKLYNDSDLMMEINELELSCYNSVGTNILKSIKLVYTINSSDYCVPNESVSKIIDSLVNKNNYKINKIYLGTGEPDLSGNTNKLSNKLSSYEFSQVIYKDNVVKLVINEEDIVSDDITEVGLGYDSESDEYILYTIQSVNYYKVQSSSKCILEYIFRII